MIARPALFAALMFASLAACGGGDDGTLDVALIGTEEEAFTDGVRLSSSAQTLRAATRVGLVVLDAQGEVVPALAEAWIITDDGLSFIFRLREGTWPDGSQITAASVQRALQAAVDDLDGTSLGVDLRPIAEIRAMAGRVIEIRLSTPEPYILQLLAQPELAIRHEGGDTGPMLLTREEGRQVLEFFPPADRGLPQEDDWQEHVRRINLVLAPAEQAISLFDAGDVALVLGGNLGSLPLVETGPLSSGTLRIDAAYGLFGLQVYRQDGLLGNDGVREALAMAIDREELLGRFNIGGWVPTTRPVSPGLPGDPGMVAERWRDVPIADRRAEAAARIAAWRRQFDQGDNTQAARVTIALGEGRGWGLLLRDLTRQLATVGIALERAEAGTQADLVVVDRIARYPAPRWFLNQFNCSLRAGLCDESTDALVETALAEPDPVARATLLAEAEARLTLANVYIPLGAPLRWSLVRGSVDGFMANARAFHPLPPLAEIPR